MAELIDHKQLAESRLATQFPESVKLINYIRALLYEADTLEDVFQKLLSERWVDTARGVNLDIIGAIVGQNRDVVSADFTTYFGYAPNPQANGYGDLNDPEIGGRFRSLNEPLTGNRSLTDTEYRIFIKARIIKNKTKSTIEDVIEVIRFIFGDIRVVLNEGTTSYTVSIGKKLTLNEKSFLLNTSIVPKTLGVSVYYVGEFDPGDILILGSNLSNEGLSSVANYPNGAKLISLI